MLNFDLVLGGISKLANYGERCLTMAGHEVQNQIRDRSQDKQVSPSGVPFKPLSNVYRKRKERSGRPGKPNLTWTGDYMNSIKPRKEGEEIHVGPGDDYLEIAAGLSRDREHIGIAPETIPNLEQKLVEEFERSFA